MNIVDADPIEDRAIQRRRALEDERKKRILDPKLQKITVDLKVIEDQIQTSRRMREMEKDTERAYALQMVRAENYSEEAERLRRQQQREVLSKVRDTNSSLATEFHDRQRSDPRAPRNQRPPRTEEDTGDCGVSCVQVLEGEDWAYDERKRQQQQQRKIWYMQSMIEKEQREQELREKQELETNYWRETDKFGHYMMSQERKLRREKDQEYLKQNVLEAERKHANPPKKEPELTTLVTQAWEDLKLDRPHIWKFFTEEQRKQIQEEQEEAAKEIKRRKEAEAKTRGLWSEHDNAVTVAGLNIERDEVRLRREKARQVELENLRKAQEDRHRRVNVNREFTSNVPTDDFFKQFSTTSR